MRVCSAQQGFGECNPGVAIWDCGSCCYRWTLWSGGGSADPGDPFVGPALPRDSVFVAHKFILTKKIGEGEVSQRKAASKGQEKSVLRKILYIIILLALLFVPLDRLDAAKLQPVEAFAVYKDGEGVVVETDSGDLGKGKGVEEALRSLKENASQIIYLDTAEYLLAAEEAREEAQEIISYLKRNIKQGTYKGGDIKEEAKYLDAHAESDKPKGGN